jgi:hypothetical protein
VNLCPVNLCPVNLCPVNLCPVNLCPVNLCPVKIGAEHSAPVRFARQLVIEIIILLMG